MDITQFKGIPDFKDRYKINRQGVVISMKYRGNGGVSIIKSHKQNNGYLNIKLFKDKKKAGYSVHRLVALTYIKNPQNKKQVNHKNGVRTDNNVENLEWVTHHENVQHAFLKLGRTNNHKNKAVLQYKKTGELVREYISLNEAGNVTGISRPNISSCCAGRLKSAGGFKWAHK